MSGRHGQAQGAKSQMTVGELVARLQALPQTALVWCEERDLTYIKAAQVDYMEHDNTVTIGQGD